MDIDYLRVNMLRAMANCLAPNIGKVRATDFVSINNVGIGDRAVL
jgi:hypothetical protein